MKPYVELKAEMETIQQQMAEAKKKEHTNALKEVKRLFKEFGLSAALRTLRCVVKKQLYQGIFLLIGGVDCEDLCQFGSLF